MRLSDVAALQHLQASKAALLRSQQKVITHIHGLPPLRGVPKV